ncbi:Nose resistant to fluoxetine protein 6 [Sarcoptes scabiei]|nr:Nose resistant to fluoxetine protein 6 [Sarcoptes scabiei]
MDRKLISPILILFLLLVNRVSICYAKQCSANFFDCGNGKCIAGFFRCDGDNDCGNNRDELAGCFHDDSSSFLSSTGTDSKQTGKSTSNCPDDSFDCRDEMQNCIPKRWVCDGIAECLNESDERNCTTAEDDCGDDFRCNNRECISKTWRCDGIFDCADQSDEKNCTQFQKVSFCDREHNKFQCMGNKCIDLNLVCNDQKDCPHGDDEGSICHVKKCDAKQCEHFCMIDNETNKPSCYCRPGYKLINQKQCTDYDECAENKIANYCDHICINTDGHYRCDCHQGYDLVNNSTCKAKTQSPILFFSTGLDIHGYDLRAQTMFPAIKSTNPSETIVTVDVLASEKKLFYSIFKNESYSSVFSISFNSIDNIASSSSFINQEKRLLFHDSQSQIEGLSVDWLANHIYLTEFNKNRIIVCSTETLICATLMNYLPSPRGILVLPTKAMLFWTQWGEQNGIFSAKMDGSDATKMFGDIEWPNDLVFDEETNRLYWCEGKNGLIEYYDFDIEVRQTVFKDKLRQPYSLFVFENLLYWTDWTYQQLIKCGKISCHNHETIFRPTLNKGRGLYGISMMHPLLQRSSSAINPCRNHPCSHLCLIKTNNSFSCYCPDHTYLDNDQRTCVSKQGHSFLIVSTGFKLFKYFPDSITNPFEQISLKIAFSIHDLAYNHHREELYLYDQFKDRIVMVDLKKGLSNHLKVLIDYDLEGVFGLSYDINTDNIYWVDIIKGSLEVASVNNSHRAIINSKLEQPISMTIDAPTKTIYVGLKTKHAQIVALGMDGTFLRNVLKTELGLPMTMTTFFDELIWGDPIIQKIDFITLKNHFNLMDSYQPKRFIQTHVGTVQSLVMIDSGIYWTNADSPKLYRASLNSSVKSIDWQRIPDKDFDNDNLKIISGLEQKQIYDYCNRNSSCPHLCLIGNYGPVCRCSLGYETKDGGKTCIRNRSMLQKKPIIHILSLDNIFDFIFSKQKDQLSDTWVHDENEQNRSDSSSINDDSRPKIDNIQEQQQNEKQNETDFNSLIIEKMTQSKFDGSESSSSRASLFFWLIFILISLILILLSIKFNLFRTNRFRFVMDYIRTHIPIQDLNSTRTNSNNSKQVRFVTNPNYNPSHFSNKKLAQQQQQSKQQQIHFQNQDLLVH